MLISLWSRETVTSVDFYTTVMNNDQVIITKQIQFIFIFNNKILYKEIPSYIQCYQEYAKSHQQKQPKQRQAYRPATIPTLTLSYLKPLKRSLFLYVIPPTQQYIWHVCLWYEKDWIRYQTINDQPAACVIMVCRATKIFKTTPDYFILYVHL